MITKPKIYDMPSSTIQATKKYELHKAVTLNSEKMPQTDRKEINPSFMNAVLNYMY